MSKIGKVAVICVMVFIAYLSMLIIMPFVSDMASTANVTIAASVNVTDFPGSTPFLLAIPWILWWVLGVMGMVAVVIVLKQPD